MCGSLRRWEKAHKTHVYSVQYIAAPYGGFKQFLRSCTIQQMCQDHAGNSSGRGGERVVRDSREMRESRICTILQEDTYTLCRVLGTTNFQKLESTRQPSRGSRLIKQGWTKPRALCARGSALRRDIGLQWQRSMGSASSPRGQRPVGGPWPGKSWQPRYEVRTCTNKPFLWLLCCCFSLAFLPVKQSTCATTRQLDDFGLAHPLHTRDTPLKRRILVPGNGRKG